MKKGFITCIASLLFTAITFAASVIVDNIEWHYTVEDGNATLEYSSSYSWTPAISKNTSGAIIIPTTLDGYPVVAIGDHAFYDCSNLTSIEIPDSVILIDDFATFLGCTKLIDINVAGGNTIYASVDGVLFDKALSRVVEFPQGKVGDVTLPPTVTSIDSGTFYQCINLTSITLPPSVTSIDTYAFSGCSGLMSIMLPVNLTSIGDAAFSGCSRLTNITIPLNVVSIGNEVFAMCSSLESITLPPSLTSIGSYTFSACSSLKSLSISKYMTSIGGVSFFGCSNLMRIDVAEENTAYTSVDGVLFDKALRQIVAYPAGKEGAFVIPDSVTTIKRFAFANCSRLTNVTIPMSVTAIDDFTFYHCSNLTNITIPTSVTLIGESAFSGCSSLESLSIPANVTSIDDAAFANCSSLARIDVAEDNKKYASLDGVMFSKSFRSVIVCPAGKSGEFAIPDGVRWVESEAFLGCSNLTKVKIPASIISIGEYAVPRKSTHSNFRGCSMPSKDPVFYRCTSLTHIDVAGDNATYASVDGVLFDKSLRHVMQCPEGTVGEVTLPASVTSLGGCSFYNCSSLTSLVFEGNAPTQVESEMFRTEIFGGVFNKTSPGLVIYYHEGTTGWTNPWHGIKTQMIKKN